MRQYVLGAVVSGCVVGLVLASPLAMVGLLRLTDDWSSLSDVGQAYGGISAVLSALAFCGIAVSVTLQWQQNRQMKMVAARERHFELNRLSLEDPTLIWDRSFSEDLEETRRFVYLNLWVGYWLMQWDLRVMSEPELRVLLLAFFQDPTAHRWWAKTHPRWAFGSSRRQRRFFEVIEECHRESGQPEPEEECPESRETV
ncbi:DUF6082 family protein [Actinoplanes sp. NPDC051851]|uniref:DUF6082 family protein n=1 Tax=Actinoplanes sp. NPDC051851 TaxID=3154753 RepID=UPI00341B1DC0